jgi:2'-5' RNA ligase
MSYQQPYLPGLEPKPLLHNLFFGILSRTDPVEQIARRTEYLRRELGLKGKPIGRERFHVSLHGIGECKYSPSAVVAKVREAAEAAAVSVLPFELVFDRAMSFDAKRMRRPSVLRAGNDFGALLTLHRLLGDAMKATGIGRRVKSNFTPHITLLYDRRVVRELAIEPIRLAVHDFVLVHSFVGQSRYIELARWQLGG